MNKICFEIDNLIINKNIHYINSYNNLKNPFQIAYLYICCIHCPHVAIQLNKYTENLYSFLIRVLLKRTSRHPSLLDFCNNPLLKSTFNYPGTVSLVCNISTTVQLLSLVRVLELCNTIVVKFT